MRVGPRIARLVDEKQPLSDGDKTFLAMRLKKTAPLPSADHGLPDFVDCGDVDVRKIPRGAPYGEESFAMGPGGTVPDNSTDE